MTAPSTLTAIARDKWVETVLRDVAGWAESLSWGQVPGVAGAVPEPGRHGHRASSPRSDRTATSVRWSRWSIPSIRCGRHPTTCGPRRPIDRMEALLRENGIQIGIVTDGRWWGLVCAREDAMAASGIVDALTWVEEPRTRDAFLTLIARQYIIGGDADERLPVLFERVGRRRRGDHRSPGRPGAPRGRAAGPVVLRVRRGRDARAASPTRCRPTPTRSMRPQ